MFPHLLICFLDVGAEMSGNKTDVFCVNWWLFHATCCIEPKQTMEIQHLCTYLTWSFLFSSPRLLFIILLHV